MGSSDKDEALGVAVHVGDEENIKAEHDEHTLPKPDSIATLNDEELNLLKKRMVRKMDLVIMCVSPICEHRWTSSN